MSIRTFFRPAPPSLTELMLRYVDGDARAFDALYRAIEPRVRARLRAIVGPGGPVDDLVQVTFMQAHRARDRWVPQSPAHDSHVVAWFRAIAHNAAMSDLRRAVPRATAGAEGLDERPGTAPDPEVAFADAEHQDQRRQTLLHALDQLRPSDRELMQRLLDGESPSHVAEALGLAPVATRVRAHRARSRLRAVLTTLLDGSNASGDDDRLAPA